MCFIVYVGFVGQYVVLYVLLDGGIDYCVECCIYVECIVQYQYDYFWYFVCVEYYYQCCDQQIGYGYEWYYLFSYVCNVLYIVDKDGVEYYQQDCGGGGYWYILGFVYCIGDCIGLGVGQYCVC